MNTHREQKVNMKHNIISEMKTKPDALLGILDLAGI